jgi:flagellin-like protein
VNKLIDNKKALSPVVAAIILIAVTVAVSIAVAAWMGSLTLGFMENSELTITHIDFTHGNSTEGRIFVNVTNSGTSKFTVKNIRVNGEISSNWSFDVSATIEPGESERFNITQAVAPGNKYAVSLYDMDGTLVGAYISTA